MKTATAIPQIATALAIPEPPLGELLADADHGHTPYGRALRATTSVSRATEAAEHEAVCCSVDEQFPAVAAFLADGEKPRAHTEHPARKVAHIEETELDEGVPMMFREFPDKVRMAFDPKQIGRDEASALLHLRVECDEAPFADADEARQHEEAPVGTVGPVLAAIPEAITADLCKEWGVPLEAAEADEEDYPLDPAAESYAVTCAGASGALITAEVYSSDDPERPGSVIAVYPEQGAGDDLDVAGADKLIADLEQFLPRLRALRDHLATLTAEATR